jgi:metallophosphoesterase superfamily enzyme
MNEHDLVAQVRQLASELGRVPTKTEFISNMKGSFYQITILFGSYTKLLKAAGLETYDERRTKRNKSGLTNEIFRRDLSEVLDEYAPREPAEKISYTPTLIIPDTHFPFVNQYVLEAAYKFAEKHKPKRIIQIGDLYDMYCHAKFPRSHNIYTPAQEEEMARSGAEKMWLTLRSICPDAECVQLKGNHDIRPLKRTLESLPSLERVVSVYLDRLMTFDGVRLISDPREEYIVEGIEFIHGHYSRLGQHRDYALMNAVCGHAHVGGVVFRRARGQTLWELNAGLAGDPESKALSHTPQRIVAWTPGFGWIDEYGPRFIPA